MKKQKRTVVCLIAGVALLAVSATAAFGSITGYSQYKDSVLALALEEENFSGLGSFSLTLDGEPQMAVDFTYVQDGPDRSSHFTGTEFGRPVDTWDVMIDGVSTWFTQDSDYYYQGETTDPPNTFLTLNADDEYEARILYFMNVAADTVVGDLKNNFVHLGTQEGLNYYQVDISQEQIPTLVSAGLSLLAVSQQFDDTFAKAFAQDLALERIHCTFSIDHDGRLVDTQLEIPFLGTDAQGITHPMVLAGELTVSEYGRAVVQPADVGDRILYQ